jgi:hypothetical protein
VNKNKDMDQYWIFALGLVLMAVGISRSLEWWEIVAFFTGFGLVTGHLWDTSVNQAVKRLAALVAIMARIKS